MPEELAKAFSACLLDRSTNRPYAAEDSQVCQNIIYFFGYLGIFLMVRLYIALKQLQIAIHKSHLGLMNQKFTIFANPSQRGID